jgi:hypothetical protein
VYSGDFADANFGSRVRSTLFGARSRDEVEVHAAHLSKTAKGGAASFVELQAGFMGPSSGVARFACDSASSDDNENPSRFLTGLSAPFGMTNLF